MNDNIKKELEITTKEMMAEEFKTTVAKIKFLKTIKTEFGKEMKNNPRQVKIIKLTLSEKIGNFFRKLFSNF